jgi:S1-C subfamily serine protease
MQQLTEIARKANTNGELIGINSAIASQTGAMLDSFAIPINSENLIQVCSVNRGILGVAFLLL